MIPKISPEATAAATEKHSTRQSKVSFVATMVRGTRVSRNIIAGRASATPAAAPKPARTRLSVRNCTSRRARPAPKALRTAASRSRVAPRASSRLARLAQAISKTHPDAHSSTTKDVPVRPASCSRTGTRTGIACELLGLRWATCFPSAVIAVRACSRVTPGLRRPMQFRK